MLEIARIYWGTNILPLININILRHIVWQSDGKSVNDRLCSIISSALFPFLLSVPHPSPPHFLPAPHPAPSSISYLSLKTLINNLNSVPVTSNWTRFYGIKNCTSSLDLVVASSCAVLKLFLYYSFQFQLFFLQWELQGDSIQKIKKLRSWKNDYEMKILAQDAGILHQFSIPFHFHFRRSHIILNILSLSPLPFHPRNFDCIFLPKLALNLVVFWLWILKARSSTSLVVMDFKNFASKSVPWRRCDYVCLCVWLRLSCSLREVIREGNYYHVIFLLNPPTFEKNWKIKGEKKLHAFNIEKYCMFTSMDWGNACILWIIWTSCRVN